MGRIMLKKPLWLLSAVVFQIALWSITSMPALSQSLITQGHVPPVGDYISYCNGAYHGLPYCNFTDSFTVGEDAVAASLVWFDIGCSNVDATSLELYYVLA